MALDCMSLDRENKETPPGVCVRTMKGVRLPVCRRPRWRSRYRRCLVAVSLFGGTVPALGTLSGHNNRGSSGGLAVAHYRSRKTPIELDSVVRCHPLRKICGARPPPLRCLAG